MGACLGGNNGESGGVGKEIHKNMANDFKVDRAEKKLLLLGTGSSGKSTIFKGLKMKDGEEIDEHQIIETQHTIRANIVTGIIMLLRKGAEMCQNEPEAHKDCLIPFEDEGIADAVKFIMGFQSATFTDESVTQQELTDLGKVVKLLWNLDSVRAAWMKRGGRFHFADNMDYFFNNCENIMMTDYIPSDEDILKARVRTTGMVDRVYEKDENIFRIFDVGGQRNERKKWVHHFEGVSAVIFVAALNHFDVVLFEDENTNAMHEAVTLFTEICANAWFRTSEMILFLNKDDLFRQQIADGVSLSECFSEKKGWLGDLWVGTDYIPDPERSEEEDAELYTMAYTEAKDFIQNVFVSQNQIPSRMVFAHTTCATDTDQVEKVFWDVQNMVIRSNLKRGGLMV